MIYYWEPACWRHWLPARTGKNIFYISIAADAAL
jgi:hypothetical protein